MIINNAALSDNLKIVTTPSGDGNLLSLAVKSGNICLIDDGGHMLPGQTDINIDSKLQSPVEVTVKFLVRSEIVNLDAV